MPMDEELEDYIKKLDPTRLSHKELAVRYKNLGEDDKAIHEFEESAKEGAKIESRLPEYIQQITQQGIIPRKMTDEEKKDTRILVSHAGSQLRKSIELNLAHSKPDYAKQLVEWAAENAKLSDETLKKVINDKRFEDIANAHLWRGYALLLMGMYAEACPLLKEVMPYFVRYRKSFGTIFWVVEYHLPKALIPLCEYKLEPNDANKKKAIKGLNDYIHFLKVDKRIQGYLFYYHLREMFPEVYAAFKESI